MTLFDGRIDEMNRTLNSRDQEARGVVYLWAEKWLSRKESILRIVRVSLLRLIRCISALILDGVGQNSELLSEVHSLEIELECKFRVIQFLS